MTMPFCTNCGKEVKDGINHCPHCGAPLRASSNNPPSGPMPIHSSVQKKRLSGDAKYLPIITVIVIVVVIGSAAGYYYSIGGGGNSSLPWGSDGGNITITSTSYRWADDMYNSNYRLLIIDLNLTNDKDVAVLTNTYNMLRDDGTGRDCWFLTTSDGVVVNAYYISTPSLPDRLSAHTNYSFSVAVQVPNGLSVTKLQYTNYWLSNERFSIYFPTVT